MRCYHLNNFYLGGIHAGIQSAHAQHELALKYWDNTNFETVEGLEARNSYFNWAQNHKTIIVLNAGMQSDLLNWEFFLSHNHKYAWAAFREAEEALNGTLTNIGLVLPSRMYTDARVLLGAFSSLKTDGDSTSVFGASGIVQYLVERQPGGFIVTRYMPDQTETFAPVAEKWFYEPFDVDVMQRLSKCNLM